MTDFRNYNPHSDSQEEMKRLNWRLVLVSALGFPFVLCFGLTLPIFLGVAPLFPFLENRELATGIFVIGVVGLVIETVWVYRISQQINRIKRN